MVLKWIQVLYIQNSMASSSVIILKIKEL